MAIFHLSTKTVSRSAGQSSVAKAAYRAGEKLYDERQGRTWDYTHRQGVEYKEIVLPDGTTGRENDRGKLWNDIEAHHKRKDAIVAREIEIALPAELTPEHRRELALEFVREIVEKYGVGADVAIHQPDRKGDQRNHHAHILLTGCHVSLDGTLGKKANELDPIHCQRAGIPNVTAWGRERWGELANTALEKAGREERIDHRTLKAQGIEREPGIHLGPSAIGYERRTGEKSQRREDYEDEINARLAAAAEAGREERAKAQRRGPRLELDGSERWRDELARFEREAARERAVEEKLAAKAREEEEEEERRKQEARNRFFIPVQKEEEKRRHYIETGPWDVDLVRAAGAEFDYRTGKWYVPADVVATCLTYPTAIVEAWQEEIERQKREIQAEHEKKTGRVQALEKTRYEALRERYAEYEAKGESSESMQRLKGKILETREKILSMELKPDEAKAEAEKRAKRAAPSVWLAVKIVGEEQRKKAREEAEKKRKEVEARKRTSPKPKGRGFW